MVYFDWEDTFLLLFTIEGLSKFCYLSSCFISELVARKMHLFSGSTLLKRDVEPFRL